MKIGDPVTLHFIHAADTGPIITEPLVMSGTGHPLSTGGRYAIACCPHRSDLGVHLQATDEPALVNCEQCRSTDVYKKLYRPLNPVKKEAVVPVALDSVARRG